MSGLKLGCPVPFKITAWSDINLYVSLDAYTAQMVLSNTQIPNSVSKMEKVGEIVSFWNNSFSNLAVFDPDLELFGKLMYSKGKTPDIKDFLWSAFLLKYLMIESNNEIDHSTMARTVLSSELSQKEIIATAIMGGVVLRSEHFKSMSRLYIPAGMSYAVVSSSAIGELLSFTWVSEELAFWLQGLFNSNFELLEIAKSSVISSINPKAYKFIGHLIWILPLNNGSHWWIASRNSFELNNAISELKNLLEGLVNSRESKLRVLNTSICSEGAFLF